MSVYIDTLLDSALSAYESGHTAETETLLRLLLGRCGPRDAQAMYVLGHLARLGGRPQEAEWFLLHTLQMQPDQALAHAELGEIQRALGRPQEALGHFERAVALDPSLPLAYHGLATVLVRLQRPQEALRWAKDALGHVADQAGAHADLGAVLGRMGRHSEAMDHYDQALALRPDDPRARYFRSLIRLGRGEMPQAWADHEARLALPAALSGRRSFEQPLWNGEAEALAGRTILLHGEQGFGDTIQFVRYVPMVAERAAQVGGRVLLAVQRGLGLLCETVAGAEAVFRLGDTLPPFDLHCPLMSLPYVFATELGSIPADVPYLTPDRRIRDEWAGALGPWSRMRVAIAWSGNPAHVSDRERSIPLAFLEPLLRRTDIECHAIQREMQESDRAALDASPRLLTHGLGMVDFAQTAALMSLMDLVITIDTSAAHLAGALGMAGWVMLAHDPDWRWLRDREDTPWYPTLRLFRQAHRGDWRGVLEQVMHNLDAWSVKRS